MLAEIVLPAGKDRITIAEIPALFANAIHPALPENTPRQITKLKKYPLTEENSRHWCGEGCQPFPVSLTSDDVAELNRSVWMGLPPLKLPINEPEWQPYRAAFEKKPPKDWTLKEDFLNRVTLNRDNWHNTVEVYLTEVRQAAMRGNLVPRSSATLLPLPDAIGELLLDCFVTLEDFMSFAARFEIGVRVAEFVLKPQAKPVEAETTEQRRARWLDLFGNGERGAVQRVYEREFQLNPKADRSFIGKEIQKARKEKAEIKRGGAMFGQLVQDGKRKA